MASKGSMTMKTWRRFTIVLLFLAGGFGRASGQTLTTNAIAEDGLRIFGYAGYPFVLGWGYGRIYDGGGNADETIIDFDLSGIPQTTPVSNATLTFFVQNQFDDGVTRTIDLSIFYGESTIQAADWYNGVYYQSCGDSYGVHVLDMTSAVQSAIVAGQSFLDLRMSTPDGVNGGRKV
jgi:hypothetical protein